MKHEYPKVEVDDKSIAEKRKQINIKKPLVITDGHRPHNRLLTLLGLGLIKINDVSANFNNPRPSWATFKDRKWELRCRP